MFFDPLYLLFLAPAILLAGLAQLKVKSTYAEASNIRAGSGLSGADVAAHMLQAGGIRNVGVEISHGIMSDHYDPKAKMLRLSADVYHGNSLASLGIAAHEAGHALQDKQSYTPLVFRNAIVPMASIGSNMSWVLLFIGAMLNSFQLVIFGIGLFSLVVVFQLVNLPVEFNASSRAKEILFTQGFISSKERAIVSKVLNAAALTYVAATLTALLTLIYYLFRFGLIGRRSN